MSVITRKSGYIAHFFYGFYAVNISEMLDFAGALWYYNF
jgi:hypothetical protein